MPHDRPIGAERRAKIPDDIRLLIEAAAREAASREVDIRVAPHQLTSEERQLLREMGAYYKARKETWQKIQTQIVGWMVAGLCTSVAGLIMFILRYFLVERKGPPL